MRPADHKGTAMEKTVCYGSHEEAGSPHHEGPLGAAAWPVRRRTEGGRSCRIKSLLCFLGEGVGRRGGVRGFRIGELEELHGAQGGEQPGWLMPGPRVTGAEGSCPAV